MGVLKKIWKILENILHFIIYRIFHVKLNDSQWKTLIQFVKFGIIGLSNVIVSYVFYLAFLLLFQKSKIFPSTDYLVAQILGFALSVLWSFYWNRKCVFDADQESVPWLQALIKTYISYGITGFGLNTLLSFVWVEMLGVSKMIAPIINSLVSVPINFVLNKFWAFKQK